MDSQASLPPQFSDWFAARGWALHPHQQAMLDHAGDPASLLIAPTGGGKTLSGFLPTLIELGAAPGPGLHTLYVSPLKALAADIRRNLLVPLEGMGLSIRVEDRTGDTSALQRKRQRIDPPHILLTTPESLALLLTYPEAPQMFAHLQRVIVDEIHALAESKRGDQLMLGVARLLTFTPALRVVGLSATVEDPPALAGFLTPGLCTILTADPGPDPDIAMLATREPPPWAGGGGTYAIPAILKQVGQHKTTLIFHNTRAQAEIFFQALWSQNEDNLPIAIHHGALAREQRMRVEQAMNAGALRAVVCTGTLDLGLDWGDVDLVIQVGAPKNVKRLVQRIGRANHRYNAPSKALLVPANRFEVVECLAALQAVRAHDLDGEPRGPGPLDVLCQHILNTAAAGSFDADQLYRECLQAGPYADLARTDFDACLDFAATGGYALRAYDRWQRLVVHHGRYRLRDARAAAQIRLNLGTIEDRGLMKVRYAGRLGGAPLGEVEEFFASTLTKGDTFLMGGQIVRFDSMSEMQVDVTRDPGRKPKIAVFGGTKFATSTQLSARILAYLKAGDFSDLPAHTADWLIHQSEVSQLPTAERLLVESFPYEGLQHTTFWGFAGRNAMQTLGLLLTRRMEVLGLHPLGFVSTDYGVMIWGLEAVTDPAALLDPATLRDGFETWLADNALMKRSFRTVASVAGLIDRNISGQRRKLRQATMSSNLLYDTLRKHDPDHVVMRITRIEALRGLVDFGRIEQILAQFNGRIEHVKLDQISPLSAPLILEIGKVPVVGAGRARLVEDEARELMRNIGVE